MIGSASLFHGGWQTGKGLLGAPFLYRKSKGKERKMEFTVEVKDYGRHGVTVKEPRTNLTGMGDTKEAAMDDLVIQLWIYLENHDNYVPDADGPVRTIETIQVQPCL
jgi:hypothetical protein